MRSNPGCLISWLQRVKEVMGRDDIEFVKTQDLDLNKDSYYQITSRE